MQKKHGTKTTKPIHDFKYQRNNFQQTISKNTGELPQFDRIPNKKPTSTPWLVVRD